LEIVDTYYCFPAPGRQGETVVKDEVQFNAGLFTVKLDFGDPNAFTGEARWLQIGVRPVSLADPNAYTILYPWQELSPTPYALYAKSAESAANAKNAEYAEKPVTMETVRLRAVTCMSVFRVVFPSGL